MVKALLLVNEVVMVEGSEVGVTLPKSQVATAARGARPPAVRGAADGSAPCSRLASPRIGWDGGRGAGTVSRGSPTQGSASGRGGVRVRPSRASGWGDSRVPSRGVGSPATALEAEPTAATAATPVS